MSDDLDQQTDHTLNEIFAVEVANTSLDYYRQDCAGHPHYCSDANAVIYYLAQEPGCFKYLSALGRCTVFKDRHCEHPFHYDGEVGESQATDAVHHFARAATIALIRAKRATEGAK